VPGTGQCSSTALDNRPPQLSSKFAAVWPVSPDMRRSIQSHPPQETKNTAVASEAKEIMLYGGWNFEGKKVFINKLEPAELAKLRECE
jgi:hypothetical protein